MNKNEIKQIILEEIEAAIMEMASPEQLAADSRPEEDDFSLEDEMEMARDFNDEQDAIFGKPNFVEEEGLEEASMKDVLQFMQRVNDVLKTYKSPGQKRPKKRFTPEEMKALATAMLNPEGFTSKDVIAATTYNSPAQANKFLKALEMKGLITLTSQLKKAMEPTRDPNAPETRGRKAKSAEFDMPDDALDMDFGDFDNLDLSDPLAEDKLNEIATELIGQYGPEAVNGLYMLAGVLGLPIAALLSTINDGDPLEIKDTLKDLAQSTGSNIKAKAQAIAGKLGLNENTNTMSELEKYIKQQIKEAKNPLAKKMKEIENQGRLAALETKLAAVAEMIEETEGRLTRIDEDNEFKEMMDKNDG